MIKKKGPDRVMIQQRCEIQISQAKQFGADVDLSGLTTVQYKSQGLKDGGVTHWHRCFISKLHVRDEGLTTASYTRTVTVNLQ